VLDGAVDEITCHAVGIKFHDPEIDTIFEIGGQDMKFTTFKVKDGVATDEIQEARMNYSCQAGAGQTLENMAQLLDLDVKSSLQEAALKADVVPLIDSTCGVFMEMEENRLISEALRRSRSLRRSSGLRLLATLTSSWEARSTSKINAPVRGGLLWAWPFLPPWPKLRARTSMPIPIESYLALGSRAVFARQILQLQREGREVKSAFQGI